MREKSRIITYSYCRVEMDESIPNADNKPLKQLSIQFDCNSIDSDEISEILFELGVLSVSVEVIYNCNAFYDYELL